MPEPTSPETKITPILVSVNDAAATIGLTPWSVYRLCDKGLIESRYSGSRRLVVFESLREYAANLPTRRPA